MALRTPQTQTAVRPIDDRTTTTNPKTPTATPARALAFEDYRNSTTITEARDGRFVVTADLRRTTGSVASIAYERGNVDLDTALQIARDWLAKG